MAPVEKENLVIKAFWCTEFKSFLINIAALKSPRSSNRIPKLSIKFNDKKPIQRGTLILNQVQCLLKQSDWLYCLDNPVMEATHFIIGKTVNDFCVNSKIKNFKFNSRLICKYPVDSCNLMKARIVKTFHVLSQMSLHSHEQIF